jgi:hypothetical protein
MSDTIWQYNRGQWERIPAPWRHEQDDDVQLTDLLRADHAHADFGFGELLKAADYEHFGCLAESGEFPRCSGVNVFWQPETGHYVCIIALGAWGPIPSPAPICPAS